MRVGAVHAAVPALFHNRPEDRVRTDGQTDGGNYMSATTSTRLSLRLQTRRRRRRCCGDALQ